MTLLLDLPDELLLEIAAYLPATSAAKLAIVAKRLHKISSAPLLWQRHVRGTWKYWANKNAHLEQTNGNPSSPPWQAIYASRWKLDTSAIQIFEDLLSAQQSRFEKIEALVVTFGQDVKDLLLHFSRTPDDADDVLARRYWADATLGLMNRMESLTTWDEMQYQDSYPLDKALSAFDTFVQGNRECDEAHLNAEFDRIAEQIRERLPAINEMGYTTKASAISAEMRKMGLVGSSEEEYNALKNVFMCHVLKSEHKQSLPMISVAIFCCVARRFDLCVSPCNFLFHVYAVLESPDYPPLYETRSTQTFNPGVVWMDPWRDDIIIDLDTMLERNRLAGGAFAEGSAYSHLAPAFTRDMVIRSGRNIMRSVEEARDGVASFRDQEIDIDAAFYSFLWSFFLVGLNDERDRAQQRRNLLPYLLDHFRQHFPQDICLVEDFVLPAFDGHPAQSQLRELIDEHRDADVKPKLVSRRGDNTSGVKYRIGQMFRHPRYNYVGVIIGWDPVCQAGEHWITQMGVDSLPSGRTQSFYQVL